MYITLTKNSTQIGTVIEGERLIALREIYFSAAWNNISSELENNKIIFRNLGISNFIIPDGYYDFCTLKKLIKDRTDMELNLNTANSIVTLTVPASRSKLYTVIFQKKLAELLGFKVNLFSGFADKIRHYVADNPIKLTLNKIVFVHLDELSTTENILNGNRSNLLQIFPSGESAFCKPVNYTFKAPQYRRLREGIINSLTVTLKNENGEVLNVKDMVLVFEII